MLKNIAKVLHFSIIFWLLISCSNNEIDKLLKEADLFINNKDHSELFEQIISNDSSKNVRAMAEFTRFTLVIEELEKQKINMSVKQLEKYLLLSVDAMKIAEELTPSGGRQQTIITDPSSPYVGRRPEYSFYDGIGSISIRTTDIPNSSTVTVEMLIGYDLNDSMALNELISRRFELRDFIRRFFMQKSASELTPEKEEQLKNEILQQLNTSFFETARVRVILFNKFDVMEAF